MNKERKNELIKSILIGVAALVALVCWLKFQPKAPVQAPKEKIGKKLFDSFDDPSKMTKLEFSGIDPQTGELRELLLVRDDSEWRLPALSGFPAENSEQLAKVVAPLVQLSVLDVVDETTNASDSRDVSEFHRECGLINPSNFDVERSLSDTDEKAEDGQSNLAEGAALHVTIKGEGDDELLNLLIGSRAPESSATRDDRFIRLPNEEVVYTADFMGDSTQETGTTEFTEYPNRISFNPIDWVDRDLLRISRWDILFLTIRDYSFSIQRNDNELSISDYRSGGIVVFKQTPENSMSRIWSLERRFDESQPGTWKENKEIVPDSANNETLNLTADELGKLNIVDVRRKPAAMSSLFHSHEVGTQLNSHAETLSEFGFAMTSQDPLDPERVEPTLIGEGGSVELTTKTGVKIALVFGKKFEDKRAVLAYASYSREALAMETEDEGEIEFLEPDAKEKAEIKNERFADWFYLIDESDYENLHFKVSETVK